ncbi:MAG: hypothetical protein ACE5JN_13940 [Candidatus Methylomirabilia bacterium]
MLLRLVIALLGVALSAGIAAAQSATPTVQRGMRAGTTPEANLHEGAFVELSPGNQKIARELFAVQKAKGEVTTATLSLDDIAAMKEEGRRWGEIIQKMLAQGLIQRKKLDRVVSPLRHRHQWVPPRRVRTRADGRGTTTDSTASRGRGAAAYKSTGPVITSGGGRTYIGWWSDKRNGVSVLHGRGMAVISPRPGSHGLAPGYGAIENSRHRHGATDHVSRGHGHGEP